MRALIVAAFAALALSGCSIVTPKLDELTGTTLAERCADYEATLATLELLLLEGVELNDRQNAEYRIAYAFVTAKCRVPAPADMDRG